MATGVKSSASGLVAYRLTVDQFLRMVVAGVLTDRERVELVRGKLVARMTKNNPHNFTVDALARRLRALLEPGPLVREEKSVRLGRYSRPEPDLAVMRGPVGAYRDQDPQAGDLLTVVEVSDSTYAKDRNAMWSLYAGAGVPVYWVINLPERRIEVYSDPTGKGRSAGYRRTEILGEGSEVPVVIEGRDIGKIAVKDVLP